MQQPSARPSVLLIDSDADNRDMYAEYLALSCFDVVVTADAHDALACAPKADVIVTGIRIRGAFDGIELIRRLRQDHRTMDKPLICLSACTFEPDRMRALLAGCDAFLPKPCLPDLLVDELRRVLAARSVPRPAPLRADSSSSKRTA